MSSVSYRLPPTERAKAEKYKRLRVASGAIDKSPYVLFQERYFNDPVGFVENCIVLPKNGTIADYQADTMNVLVSNYRSSIRASHGTGKTCLAAWVVHWFALTRDGMDWKIPCTASAWRQLTKFLFPEIHKWARYIKWEAVGRRPYNERTELLSLSLHLRTGEAFALASDNSALIEGAHAEQLLYIFDESKVVPDETWDSAEGAFSVGSCFWLAVSTPGEPIGRFYDIHSRKPGYEDWSARHVRMEEAIAAGRMSQAWADQRKAQWGENSPVYKNRVLGEFASSGEDSVIPLDAVERSNQRWQELKENNQFGKLTHISVDVGRGGDPSVVGLRHGRAIKELRHYNVADTMQITGVVAGLLRKSRKVDSTFKEIDDTIIMSAEVIAIVDVIGIGAGVYDRLREEYPNLIHSLIPFVASQKSNVVDSTGEVGFADLRSAGWWTLRDLLISDEIDLPPDDKLTGDLTAPRWKLQSGGKIKVESKDDIRKRIGRSTDDGDVVMQAFAPVINPTGMDLIGFI